MRQRQVGGVQISTTTGAVPWISGCPADLLHRLVRFDEKQNLGSRQVKRVGSHVVGRIARSCSLAVRTRLVPHFRQTGLERTCQLVERSLEIVRKKAVRTYHLEKVQRPGPPAIMKGSCRAEYRGALMAAVDRLRLALPVWPVPERHVLGELLSSLLRSGIFEAESA